MLYRFNAKVTGYLRWVMHPYSHDALAEAWGCYLGNKWDYEDFETEHQSLGIVESSEDGETWTEVPPAELEAAKARWEGMERAQEAEMKTRQEEEARKDALPPCTDEEIAVQALAYLRKEKAKGYMEGVWSIVGNGLEPWCKQTGKKVPSEAKVSAVLRKLENQDKVYAERDNHRAVYWQICE